MTHTLILKQIFLTIIQCSTNNKDKGFQPTKINMTKSKFCASAVLYLGKIQDCGIQVIDINHFKTTSKQDMLSTSGAELTLAFFFNYFMDHMPCLSYVNKDLR